MQSTLELHYIPQSSSFSAVLCWESWRSSGLLRVLWILLGYYVVYMRSLAYREGNILLGVYLNLVECYWIKASQAFTFFIVPH